CHMPLMASNDFGAKFNEIDPAKPLHDALTVHDHMFPSANTAIPKLVNMPDWETTNKAHDDFARTYNADGSVKDNFIRMDLFAVHDGGSIESPIIAPLRPQVPAIKPGGTYLIDLVIRTLKI